MSGGGMQGQQGVGTAASGGKGGQMGGPQMQTAPSDHGLSGPGAWGGKPQMVDGPGMTGGGKGGNTGGPTLADGFDSGDLYGGIGGGGAQVSSGGHGYSYLPDGGDSYQPSESGGVNTTGAAAQPNAFDQGLGAMNQGMDWMSDAMNHQAPQLNGDYGVGGIDANKYMRQMGTAGGGGYAASMMTAPGQDLYDYDPAQAQAQSYQAAQLSDKNINDYMNPYTQNVIDTTMGDLNKARKQALNSTGAAATAGGAFGGDRHGIMEAQNNADYMNQVASSSAQLRNQGYQNAQRAAMGDVNAMNQSYQSNAGMAQQSNLANQQANNARSQFVGGTANSNAMQTGLANQSASNQAKALEAQLNAQASMANAQSQNSMLSQLMGYDNANQQFNAGMDFNKDQFNAGQEQQSFMNQMAGAQNLYGMGNDRWNMGQDQVDKMAGVGNQVDQLNQGYINSVMNMFGNQQNAPQEQYQQMLAAMSGQPNWGGTQSYNPGAFDYAKMASNFIGMGK